MRAEGVTRGTSSSRAAGGISRLLARASPTSCAAEPRADGRQRRRHRHLDRRTGRLQRDLPRHRRRGSRWHPTSPATMVASDGEIPIFGRAHPIAQLWDLRARARRLRPRQAGDRARGSRAQDDLDACPPRRARRPRSHPARDEGRPGRVDPTTIRDLATFTTPHQYAREST